MSGFLGSLRDHLFRSTQDLDDRELAGHADAMGATPIAELADRSLVDVTGAVRSLTIPPRGQVPALVADLYDGTGTLVVVWIGRREITGISPGVRLCVHGRVTFKAGRATMFNPRYEILPRSASGV